MLGFLMLHRLVFKMTPVGVAAAAARTGLGAVDLFLTKEKLSSLEDELKKGVNPAEETHHQKTHGHAEMFFPFRLSLSSFPENLEKVVGESFAGDFLWKLSEWNELARWFNVLFQNAQTGGHLKVGRDGRWLLQVGRERWADAEWKKQAVAARDANPEIVTAFDFILRKEEA